MTDYMTKTIHPLLSQYSSTKWGRGGEGGAYSRKGADFVSGSRDFTQDLTSGVLILIRLPDACVLGPRLHGSGQVFARTKTCHGSTLRLHGTGGTGRIFERLKFVSLGPEKQQVPNLHT